MTGRGGVLGLLVVVPFVVGFASASSPPHHVVLTFADQRIAEASGLVARDGLFVTVNDSGDTGRVFTVDSSGRTVGVTNWGDDAVDDEALAPLPHHHVLVGDIGDNLADRDSVRLVDVPVGRGDRTVTPTSYELTYPGGAVDAETVMVQPRTGQVLVVTKTFFGGTILAAPRHLRTDRPNLLRPVGTATAVATDGAFFPDGRHLVIRNYAEATVYTYPGLRAVGTLDLPRQPQGEGIAVDEQSRVYVDSEGLRSQVLRVPLPADLQDVVAPVLLRPPPSHGPPPPDSTVPDATSDHDWWPWLVGGVVGLGMIGVLVRSLRPR